MIGLEYELMGDDTHFARAVSFIASEYAHSNEIKDLDIHPFSTLHGAGRY
jgi:hypothetical protein